MSTTARIHDREEEALELGKAICYARKLATHFRPDLDATLALWICQRIRLQVSLQPAEVIFIPASTIATDSDVLALDIGSGRGLQKFGDGLSIKRSAIKGSAAMAVFRALSEEDRNLIEPIVQAISDADEKGDNLHTLTLQESVYPDGTKHWDNVILRTQIMATNMWSMFEDLSYVCWDKALVDIWFQVFDGILAAGLKRREAIQASKEADFRFEGILAILPHGAPQQTSKAVYQKGAKLVLFSSYLGNDHWTLGISRKSGDDARFIDFHDGQEILKRWVPDLFIHPGGFMAGWTIKSPLKCNTDEFKYKRQALIMAVNEMVGKAIQSKG